MMPTSLTLRPDAKPRRTQEEKREAALLHAFRALSVGDQVKVVRLARKEGNARKRPA